MSSKFEKKFDTESEAFSQAVVLILTGQFQVVTTRPPGYSFTVTITSTPDGKYMVRGQLHDEYGSSGSRES